MTDDPGGAIDLMLFTRLDDVVTLAKVFQHVPENTPPPVIILDDVAIDPEEEMKDSGLWRITASIVSVIIGPSRKPLRALHKQVMNALDEFRPPDVEGWSFGMVKHVSTDVTLLDDGRHYYGAQRFSFYVQPAG